MKPATKKIIKQGKKLFSKKAENSKELLKLNRYILDCVSSAEKSPNQITSDTDSTGNIIGNSILAAIVILVIMAAIIIFIEFTAEHLSSEVQVVRYLKIPVIGTIPELKSLKKGW